MPDFLLEIGCEELPAGYVLPALGALERAFLEAIEAEALSCKSVRTTATPRRLVFFAEEIPSETPERVVEVPGPPARIALDADGAPTRTAEGFARSQGVGLDALITKDTEKGKYIFARRVLPVKQTLDILSGALGGLIRAIPFPKSMYWKDPAFRFARPIRRILALLGDEVVPFAVNGVQSGRLSGGHPFLAPGPYEVPSADIEKYGGILREAFVIVDRSERRAKILAGVSQALAAHGGELRESALLEEVTDLVEWPEVIEGSFREDYLALPEEVVAAAMMEHQRYFPVRDGSGRMVNRFLTVANRPRQYSDLIREGNERVLAARLYDAHFFWEADCKKPLEDFAAGLSGVVYLAGLGTLSDKVERMKEIAAWAGEAAGLPEHRKTAVEAAALAKADLLTEMVGEFPSLQGVMGRAYALAQGKDPAVAAAIEEHYLPRTLSDRVPETTAGALVALADKADTLAGAFVMGLVPSGSQDPYGLRRASVGVIRIIVELGMRIGLESLLEKAWTLILQTASSAAKGDFNTLLRFVRDRLYQYYLDKGFRHDILRACMAAGFDDLFDFHGRIEAVTALSAEEPWADLVTAVERTCNITKNYTGSAQVDQALLSEHEEQVLYQLLRTEGPRVEELVAARDYREASRVFTRVFAAPLHAFFEEVFVNVDDEKVRSNRLALIKAINSLYSSRIADLSLIVRE